MALLDETKLEEVMRRKHRRTLTVHAMATVGSQTTIMLFFVSTAWLFYDETGASKAGWVWVIAGAADILQNVICMTLLSGILAALRDAYGQPMRQSHVSDSTPCDPISEIALVGRGCREGPSAVTFGRNRDEDEELS